MSKLRLILGRTTEDTRVFIGEHEITDKLCFSSINVSVLPSSITNVRMSLSFDHIEVEDPVLERVVALNHGEDKAGDFQKALELLGLANDPDDF